MDTSDNRTGWRTFSGLVLAFGGLFAAISGLTAVYRSTFFSSDAVFLFSDLNTWGWITSVSYTHLTLPTTILV